MRACELCVGCAESRFMKRTSSFLACCCGLSETATHKAGAAGWFIVRIRECDQAVYGCQERVNRWTPFVEWQKVTISDYAGGIHGVVSWRKKERKKRAEWWFLPHDRLTPFYPHPNESSVPIWRILVWISPVFVCSSPVLDLKPVSVSCWI